MLRVEELPLPDYERALKRTKKDDVISIAIYHIGRVRELEAILKAKESPVTGVQHTQPAIAPHVHELYLVDNTAGKRWKCRTCSWEQQQAGA